MSLALRNLIIGARPVRYWPIDEAPVAGGLPASWRDLARGADLTNSEMEAADLRSTNAAGPDGSGRATYFDGSDSLAHATDGLLASLGGNGPTATYSGFSIVGFFTYPPGIKWDSIYSERFGGDARNIIKIESEDGGQLTFAVRGNDGSTAAGFFSGVNCGDNRLHSFGLDRRNIDGEQLFYVDGKRAARHVSTWPAFSAGMTSRVGRDPSDPNSHWTGLIGHLAIFSTPLGAAFHRRLWEIGVRSIGSAPSRSRLR